MIVAVADHVRETDRRGGDRGGVQQRVRISDQYGIGVDDDYDIARRHIDGLVDPEHRVHHGTDEVRPVVELVLVTVIV